MIITYILIFMDAQKFLDLVLVDGRSTSITADIETSINILRDYCDGYPLVIAIKNHDFSYARFRNALKTNIDLLKVYEEAKKFNSTAMKEKLLAEIFDSAMNHNTQDGKWLLERLFPEEFGKREHKTIENINKDMHPPALEEYIKVVEDGVIED